MPVEQPGETEESEAMSEALIFGTEPVDEAEAETGDGLEIETEELPEASFDMEIDESEAEDGLEISED